MKKTALAISAFFLAMSSAHSQESSEAGFYGFVSAGPTTFNYPSGFSVETNGYQLGLGYELNKSFALETSYGSLYNIGISNSSASESSEMTMYNFSGVFRMPGEKFTPYLKGGISSFTSDYQSSSFGSGSVSSALWTYGAGGELNLDKRTALRLEYMSTVKRAGYVDGNVIQVGIMSRF
jgi:opacity protein-like surface antigen